MQIFNNIIRVNLRNLSKIEVKIMEDKKNVKNKKITKKLIILILVAAILILSGVLVLFLMKSSKSIKTDYGAVKYVEAVDASTIKFTFSAPYSKKAIEYNVNKKAEVSRNGKTYSADISNIEYHQIKSKDSKAATLTITASMENFKFDDSASYSFKALNGSVTEKKTGKSIGEIVFYFSVNKQPVGGKYYAKKLDKRNFDVEALENEISLIKENKRAFVVAKIKTDTLTTLNRKDIKLKNCGVTLAYREEEIKLKAYFDNITSSFDEATKTVTIKCPVDVSTVTSGTNYTIYISKGILLNEDKTVGSEEMTAELTYME